MEHTGNSCWNRSRLFPPVPELSHKTPSWQHLAPETVEIVLPPSECISKCHVAKEQIPQSCFNGEQFASSAERPHHVIPSHDNVMLGVSLEGGQPVGVGQPVGGGSTTTHTWLHTSRRRRARPKTHRCQFFVREMGRSLCLVCCEPIRHCPKCKNINPYCGLCEGSNKSKYHFPQPPVSCETGAHHVPWMDGIARNTCKSLHWVFMSRWNMAQIPISIFSHKSLHFAFVIDCAKNISRWIQMFPQGEKMYPFHWDVCLVLERKVRCTAWTGCTPEWRDNRFGVARVELHTNLICSIH